MGLGRKNLEVHLKGWAIQNKAAATAVLEELDDKGRAKLEELMEGLAAQHPEASLEALPRLFREPPWARKRVGPKPVTLELEPKLPAPHAVLTENETEVAQAALGAAAALDAGNLRLERYGPVYDVVAALLRGDKKIYQTAVRLLAERWWYDDNARDLALTLIHAMPEKADGWLELARSGTSNTYSASPHIHGHLAALASPVTAQFLLEGLGKKTQRPIAIDWLDRHPAYAALAWIPAALGKAKKLRSLAEAGVRLLVARGHEEHVRFAAQEYGAEAKDAIDALLATDPLEALPKKPPKSISFFNPGTLTRPKLKDRDEVLPTNALETLAVMFAVSSLDEVYPGLDIAKELFTEESLSAFGWGMFEQWMAVGAPSKESWALTSLGIVGDDEIAHRLTPMIRAWPGESQHQRAVTGLDVLLAIGTDVSLMHLNGIAQKVKFKGIKSNAQERIEKLAAELGLTREELADRLVPDLELEPDGTMKLDYGPRRFTVGFDEALKPFVKDESGKRLKNLPKPGARDDAELAQPAEARFKLLKKSVRSLASLQIQRLQTAMVVGRRWSG
ncbi:MAG: DUF4132 domain-containing protein, partial [Myxococcota bacterium]